MDAMTRRLVVRQLTLFFDAAEELANRKSTYKQRYSFIIT